MKNLKLAHKMLVLTVILMASMLAVAYVAVNRLAEVNAQIRQLVDRTILKRDAARPTCSTKLLLEHPRPEERDPVPGRRAVEGVRERVAVAHDRSAEPRFDKLKELIAADQVEGQAAAVEALGKAIDAFQKVNNDTLDLAVQNTNVKAKRLLAGDIQRQINILAAHLPEVGRRRRRRRRTPTPPTSPGSRRSYEIHAALLGDAPQPRSRHIESSSKEEMAAEEKKLAELQDQIQAGLATASGGRPDRPGRGPRRPGRDQDRCRRASSSSRDSTPTIAPPRCRSARRRPRWTSA